MTNGGLHVLFSQCHYLVTSYSHVIYSNKYRPFSLSVFQNQITTLLTVVGAGSKRKITENANAEYRGGTIKSTCIFHIYLHFMFYQSLCRNFIVFLLFKLFKVYTPSNFLFFEFICLLFDVPFVIWRIQS